MTTKPIRIITWAIIVLILLVTLVAVFGVGAGIVSWFSDIEFKSEVTDKIVVTDEIAIANAIREGFEDITATIFWCTILGCLALLIFRSK